MNTRKTFVRFEQFVFEKYDIRIKMDSCNLSNSCSNK